MSDLTLSKKFALISLNGVQVTKTPEIGPLRERCMVASQFFDFILSEKMVEVNHKYFFIYDAPGTFRENEKLVYDMLDGKGTNGLTIAEWVNRLAAIPQDACAGWAKKLIDEMAGEGLFDMIPSLLECDLKRRTAGGKIRQYRSSYGEYHDITGQIGKGASGSDAATDEVIFLIWLLKQSGDLQNIISPEAADKVLEHGLGESLSRAAWKEDTSREKRGFLSKKPVPPQNDSIFIETGKMFADAGERIADVKKFLESNGHICQIKTTGEIPVVEIDNVLYELIPDAVRVRILNVHGVRLRKR
ncbi:hypothetical protein [Clostridium sp. Marseille-P2415]|uniref:hypothetical protein n=1 Tax=Clostridium sp. Marseille-P2415 TaxID=1805471 RepID=UPI0009885396|nr:hypothetical protein [Clostridium sp. Marseille-P2415]